MSHPKWDTGARARRNLEALDVEIIDGWKARLKG